MNKVAKLVIAQYPYLFDENEKLKTVIDIPFRAVAATFIFEITKSIVQKKRKSFIDSRHEAAQLIDNPDLSTIEIVEKILARTNNVITIRNFFGSKKFTIRSFTFPGNKTRKPYYLCEKNSSQPTEKPKEKMKMAKARKPSTPGEVLLKEYLEPAGISQTDFAKHIGLATSTLSRLIEGKTQLSIRTAYRLAKATKTTVEFWVNLQLAVNLADAKTDKALAAEVKLIKLHPAFKAK